MAASGLGDRPKRDHLRLAIVDATQRLVALEAETAQTRRPLEFVQSELKRANDTDFGELAFRSGLSASCRVALIRIEWTDPEADNESDTTVQVRGIPVS